MNSPGRTAEVTLVLFLLGLLAFNPPLLSIFDRSSFVLGMPLLYVYLFCAWGLMIALIARSAATAGKASDAQSRPHQTAPNIPLPGDRKGP